MFVRQNIGPVVIGKNTHRFIIGEKLSKTVEDYFRKTKQFEDLFKNGVIGDELIRSEPSGQPGNPDTDGRVESIDDDNKSIGSKRNNKGKGN